MGHCWPLPCARSLCSCCLLCSLMHLPAGGAGYANKCHVSWPKGLSTTDPGGAVADSKVFLKTLFNGIAGTISEEEKKTIDEACQAETSDVKCAPSTYGERTVEDLWNNPRFEFGPGSVFVDIGAGIGKIVLDAVLLRNASRGIGIEVSAERHEKACTAMDRWRAMLPGTAHEGGSSDSPSVCGAECSRRLSYGAGEITSLKASALDPESIAVLREATHVLIFATCFPQGLLADLERTLLQELPAGAIVSVTPFHTWGDLRVGGRRFRFLRGPPPMMELLENGEL
eukprot:gnl/TRDRNA2_/TRDRNA2_137056_c1_seq1.p1 gnl/TRDRNA2_/TRDRNA2_137056_c1~~gnl/TRDRNA2_/TRDRNA2_137056_c1_seq1.p1  ORF type:complete len:285 (+),score=38.12 gnl/TRDRNA2_/TRDRNA2_137056_c1_seq1:36-890(+)